MRRGLFIVLYGPAGVGKTQQLEILEDTMARMGVHVRRIKYPLYRLEPTGPKLYGILHRKEIAPDEDEMQKMFAQNRNDFEPTLRSWLDSGVTVLAEDYKGTGVAWGMVRGLPLEKMEELNDDQTQPDLAIYLDGPRRMESPLEPHMYEDEEEWYKVRKVMLQLADRYGWIRVGGDAPILTVAGRIFAVVKPLVTVMR
ncbi:MAG: Thymidylate kinase [Candidatus Amesbacteria bacterium GW2011_GWA1_47_16]|uniref:Thymidylate kinase-like domain-containing protein n=5 Tax=Candidatus Amesiibacteriota TaxID=1752730 RepID=A0A1F4ZRB5_9BACT|nr:MAG: Thymidylate kinase [Candidatus Amesbacteria bacterium GW2011_GWC1_47_15]KKU64899.1 MAG: Thymidylate kinase [Candidatus Amesbacteria bacterium GW2011_GWA1_47_16]KKU97858.1 MAG: Thymidylate kinase [Candidatus Amesbacteria bacterium GW2011_GWB1_48_13]OGD00087.1 MAG: hypothetical protein A2972_01060 [Candidatus Amesbacteria bacterium RIFCSPLOWO2_01_FULL_47_33]OGD00233.1 MAG: hypothetical protein A2701_01545 [Candidatus Amesbacteria bacterium RIFCSPHIGHO2_01_FULL_47_34]OGD08999.1 MAG: hypot